MVMVSSFYVCLTFVAAQTQVPLQRQQLLYNGKEMKNFEKLSGLGVKDEDLIMMVSAGASRYFSLILRLHHL